MSDVISNPSPDEFDERFPDFEVTEYQTDMPDEIPQPYFDEAARRVYGFRLYHVASGREKTTPEMREWARKGWHAIEQQEELAFATGIVAAIREYAAADEWLVVAELLELLMWVSLRYTKDEVLFDLRRDLIMEKDSIRLSGGDVGNVVKLLDSILCQLCALGDRNDRSADHAK